MSAHSRADINLPDSLQNLRFQTAKTKTSKQTTLFEHHLQLTHSTFLLKKESYVALIFSVNFIRADVVTVVQQWTKLILLM